MLSPSLSASDWLTRGGPRSVRMRPPTPLMLMRACDALSPLARFVASTISTVGSSPSPALPAPSPSRFLTGSSFALEFDLLLDLAATSEDETSASCCRGCYFSALARIVSAATSCSAPGSRSGPEAPASSLRGMAPSVRRPWGLRAQGRGLGANW
eukprot:CAMPEP_0177571624 /NCGR_PEP_ID=MMETSP0369-20130122/77543_1 /TAXON_ID=447022 ORGANISM="Scrippsiella hangoei-like, Strain SHHI-4" /NCGR_SAMPLE_ID=MMETSP0369 /ASSEMBLY_ACC=CAM_ASM_000364 /LENGTH=154 /DNA_ID=CAMNT_0019059581 /DNA_START=201 /DNA_END=663 /DNA_ORIENTATION=+